MSELIGFLMGTFFALLIVDIVLALMYLMKKKPKKKIPKVEPKEVKPVKEKKDIFLGFRNLFPKKQEGGKEQ
jgi:hypothetical protein